MTRTINLRAPKSLRLHEMSAEEAAAFVAREADRVLDDLPQDIRPLGISAVAMDAFVKGTAADPGVWAQWTRACCDRRDRIEEFVEPVVQDFDPAAAVQRPRLADEHVESLMRVESLANPAMHGKKSRKR